MMTTTGFHRCTRPFAEDLIFADFVAWGFVSGRATTTGSVNEEFAGRTITVVARASTFMAAGQEFFALLRAERDWVLTGCSLRETCDGSFPARTEFHFGSGAGTRCWRYVLRMAFLLAGMDTTIEFSVDQINI